jgi:glycosyltransferase involved in cell wall biosynthesis
MISVVVPVYKNAANIPPLVRALEQLSSQLDGELEAVFVIDGSPDDSHLRLAQALPRASFRSQVLQLSRNFGSFAAIRAGLEAGQGDRFAVMAADLQEPPELIEQFDLLLRSGDVDVAVGQRTERNDPLLTRLLSRLFWGFYRRYVQPEIPPGGVDIFGCTPKVRDQIVRLRENNSSLVGLLFWVGFRRVLVSYERREREIGKSAWTFQKKLKYMLDSVFSFTDLPIRILTRIGFFGLLISVFLSLVVLAARLSNMIPVPGYAATMLVVTFFGALNCFGLGVIGSYVFRTFENTKFRPNFIVANHDVYAPKTLAEPRESGLEQRSHV